MPRQFHLVHGDGTLRTVVCHPENGSMWESDDEWVSPTTAIRARPSEFRALQPSTRQALEDEGGGPWRPGENGTVFVPDRLPCRVCGPDPLADRPCVACGR
jgi:hypothetical protein